MSKRAHRMTFNSDSEERQINDWYSWIGQMREKHGNKIIDEHFNEIYDVSCGGIDLKASKRVAKQLGLSIYGTGK